jgi:hypothetical protein
MVVSMFVNGLIAEHEDNAPGGFNNPLPPPLPKSETKNPDVSTTKVSETVSESSGK